MRVRRSLRNFVGMLLSLACAIGGARPALAWGNFGHEIIATIAARRLQPSARAAVAKLLAGEPYGAGLPAASTWADEIRRERPETLRWHFVDIPIDQPEFVAARDCREIPGAGDCVVAAVERERAILADRRQPQWQRTEALKFVVHLVGDIHQPLHCAERNGDRGGNDVPVVFFGETQLPTGERWNLHSVWDIGLIQRAQPDGKVYAYAARLNRWLAAQDERRLAAGTFVDWVNEAHGLARTHAYKGVAQQGAALGRAYYEANRVIVDQQLATAGVRLARVLNEALP